MYKKLSVFFISVTATSAMSSSVLAQGLTVAHGYQPNHTITADGIVPWMNCVKERTEGEIEFTHFPSGQLSAHTESIETLNNGVADLSQVVIAYETQKIPLNGLPFLPDMGDSSIEMVTAYREVLNDGGPLRDELENNDLVPLLVNVLPPYQLMSAIGPIDTKEEFNGVPIFVSGAGLMIAQALDASPVDISAADLYMAMERGTIEAAFLAYPSAPAYSLHEVVNAMSGNGIFGSGGSMLAMDQSNFEALPDEHQQIMTDCGLQVELELAERVDESNSRLKEEFRSMGVEIFDYSDEELEKLSNSMTSVAESFISRLEDRGLNAQMSYDAYQEALGR